MDADILSNSGDSDNGDPYVKREKLKQIMKMERQKKALKEFDQKFPYRLANVPEQVSMKYKEMLMKAHEMIQLSKNQGDFR